MPWHTSNRRAQLPPNWATLRATIANRAQGRCQHPGCNRAGTDCDHIGDPTDHRPVNLQWLCAPHHKAKTQQQAQAAAAARRAKLKHPANR